MKNNINNSSNNQSNVPNNGPNSVPNNGPNNNQAILVKVADWCQENLLDYVSTINILKRQKVFICKIGSDYYVRKEDVLTVAIEDHFYSSQQKSKARSELTKRKAAERKAFMNSILEALATQGLDLKKAEDVQKFFNNYKNPASKPSDGGGSSDSSKPSSEGGTSKSN